MWPRKCKEAQSSAKKGFKQTKNSLEVILEVRLLAKANHFFFVETLLPFLCENFISPHFMFQLFSLSLIRKFAHFGGLSPFFTWLVFCFGKNKNAWEAFLLLSFFLSRKIKRIACFWLVHLIWAIAKTAMRIKKQHRFPASEGKKIFIFRVKGQNSQVTVSSPAVLL